MPSSLITQFIWVMAINCLESTSTALSPWLAITAVSGITNFHHNIDRGKVGIILDANTTTYFNSVNIEVDASGSGFEAMEPGQHHQRSHESRGRRSQPVCLSFAD